MLRTAQSVYNLTQNMSDTALWAFNVWVSSLLVKAYSKIEFNSNTINPEFLSYPRSSHHTGMSSILNGGGWSAPSPTTGSRSKGETASSPCYHHHMAEKGWGMTCKPTLIPLRLSYLNLPLLLESDHCVAQGRNRVHFPEYCR